jgi:hypothetical protein
VNLAGDAFQASGDVSITKRVGSDDRVEHTDFQLLARQLVAYDVKLCLPPKRGGGFLAVSCLGGSGRDVVRGLGEVRW